MKSRTWFLGGALTLALAAAATADPPKAPPAPATDVSDPPGTTLYMDQLRAVFARWDLNHDNYLDKAELAKGFRGPDAKPYEPKAPAADAPDPGGKKPDYSDYPDYTFLVQLDQDGDGQISRDEFLTWARDYSLQLKAQADELTKVEQLEAKLAKATTSTETKRVEKELKKEQEAMSKADKEMSKELKALEKALQPHLKKR